LLHRVDRSRCHWERLPAQLEDIASAALAVGSSGPQQAELLKRSHSIIQADFLCNLAVFDAKHGRSGEAHLPAGRRGERTDQKIAERGPSMRSTAFPTTDHVVALGDEVRRAPEIEIRKRLAEARP